MVRSTGGLGQVMEFRPDGTMTQWTAVHVELTYQVHGPLLLTFYRHPGSGATETHFDAVEPWVVEPQDPAIVGVWSTPHETGQTAFLLYTSDGRVVFRLPIRADRGRWSASGDQTRMG